MNDQPFVEKLVEEKVTYTLLKDGELYLVQDVPARVNMETGEQIVRARNRDGITTPF